MAAFRGQCIFVKTVDMRKAFLIRGERGDRLPLSSFGAGNWLPSQPRKLIQQLSTAGRKEGDERLISDKNTACESFAAWEVLAQVFLVDSCALVERHVCGWLPTLSVVVQ